MQNSAPFTIHTGWAQDSDLSLLVFIDFIDNFIISRSPTLHFADET